MDKGRIVWLNGMACSGTDTSLDNCSHNGWENAYSSCNGHTWYVGVVCTGYKCTKLVI